MHFLSLIVKTDTNTKKICKFTDGVHSVYIKNLIPECICWQKEVMKQSSAAISHLATSFCLYSGRFVLILILHNSKS